MRTRHALAGALVALALTAAACGDDSGGAANTEATTESPTTTVAPATTPAAADTTAAATTAAPSTTAVAPTTTAKATTTTAAQPATLMELVNQTPQLAQFGLAITAADLNDSLKSDTELTIFAPSNDAYAALGFDTINAMNRDPVTLTPLLTYHMVPGKLLAADLQPGDLVTVNGAPVTIAVENGTVTVNGAKVVTTDLQAGNGVIHVIDTVLTPPAG